MQQQPVSCFPLQILIQIFQFLLQPVAVMFCGHLGKIELDAVALANTVRNKGKIFCKNTLSELNEDRTILDFHTVLLNFQLINVVGVSIASGMCTACDTLLSQVRLHIAKCAKNSLRESDKFVQLFVRCKCPRPPD